LSNNIRKSKPYSGVLSGLKARLRKNRLGELLIIEGHISSADLEQALALSSGSRQPLGRVLAEHQFVHPAVIKKVLIEQFTLRFLTATVTVFLSLASMGFAKQARAGNIKDIPASVSMISTSSAIAPISHYPKLFGSTEKRSSSLKAFTKWTGMFSRFDNMMKRSSNAQAMEEFKQDLYGFKDLPLHKMAAKVNEMVNEYRYILDSKNYGQTDYWATPVEFFSNGGDCEDFAITKYTALRMLGVPEERLRLLILKDMQKNIPHAVLVVYTDNGPMIMDNQIKTLTHADRIDHYKPIFSINRHAWWLHTSPRGTVTVVASSSR